MSEPIDANLSSDLGRKEQIVGGTEKQPRPNLSTERQKEGDARFPSDTLDRGQERTEDVEDRPNVGIVSPNDYPDDNPDH